MWKKTLIKVSEPVVADRWHFVTDPDPPIFIIYLQDANKKLYFFQVFLLITCFLFSFLHFSKINSHKEGKNSRNQAFYYYFCLMMEWSGSVTQNNGSGSRRPENMDPILRIRNTGYNFIYFANDPCFFSTPASRIRAESVSPTWSCEATKRDQIALDLTFC